MVLSTGMGTMQEIKKATSIIKDAGNTDLCILHCVSIYPTPAKKVNLLNINKLMNEFPHTPIGFSDHTIGSDVAPAAIALGACLIEKHFTLDKNKIGMDNQMASEPSTMKDLIEKSEIIFNSLGNIDRVLSKEELDQRIKMRRSVVAKIDLQPGDIVELNHLSLKRPGSGIQPDEMLNLVGREVKRAIKQDELIDYKDLK
jgi:N-acetylneuraminate synthase